MSSGAGTGPRSSTPIRSRPPARGWRPSICSARRWTRPSSRAGRCPTCPFGRLVPHCARRWGEFYNLPAVVHRDLKPANVLLDGPSGRKLIDFGLARATGDDRLTQPGAAGTPVYLSPEQATGREHTAAGDVFALAGVLVFATTGAARSAAATRQTCSTPGANQKRTSPAYRTRCPARAGTVPAQGGAPHRPGTAELRQPTARRRRRVRGPPAGRPARRDRPAGDRGLAVPPVAASRVAGPCPRRRSPRPSPTPRLRTGMSRRRLLSVSGAIGARRPRARVSAPGVAAGSRRPDGGTDGGAAGPTATAPAGGRYARTRPSRGQAWRKKRPSPRRTARAESGGAARAAPRRGRRDDGRAGREVGLRAQAGPERRAPVEMGS